MSICNDCGKEMLKAKSCTFTQIGNKKVMYKRIRYGEEDDDWGANVQRCHDCGVMKGGVHHNGCDVERCPKCKRQLICCECNFDLLKK